VRITGAPKRASTLGVSCTPPVRPKTSGLPVKSSPRQPIRHPCGGTFRQAPARTPSRPLLNGVGALHGGLQATVLVEGVDIPPEDGLLDAGDLAPGLPVDRRRRRRRAPRPARWAARAGRSAGGPRARPGRPVGEEAPARSRAPRRRPPGRLRWAATAGGDVRARSRARAGAASSLRRRDPAAAVVSGTKRLVDPATVDPADPADAVDAGRLLLDGQALGDELADGAADLFVVAPRGSSSTAPA